MNYWVDESTDEYSDLWSSYLPKDSSLYIWEFGDIQIQTIAHLNSDFPGIWITYWSCNSSNAENGLWALPGMSDLLSSITVTLRISGWGGKEARGKHRGTHKPHRVHMPHTLHTHFHWQWIYHTRMRYLSEKSYRGKVWITTQTEMRYQR